MQDVRMPPVCLRDIRTNLRKHTKIPLDESTQWRKEASLCPNGCYITKYLSSGLDYVVWSSGHIIALD